MNFHQVPIIKVQKFWDQRPCNIFHSDAPIGSKRYFDEVEKRKYFVEPHIPNFAQFNQWKGKYVLEIGCGIGTDTISFARAGAFVTAIDISHESLRLARRRAKVFRLNKKITFYQGNAEKLSEFVPRKQYDLIYSFGVIHHTPHPTKVINQIKNYLHRKTVLKLMVYHKYSWKVLWIALNYSHGKFWDLDSLIAKHSEAAIGSPVSYAYTKSSIKRLLTDFTILKLEVDHIFPYQIGVYKQYQYIKHWYFRYLPPRIFHYLEKNLGWHLLVTATPKLRL